MAWSTSAPGGVAWGDWVEGAARINVNNYNNYRIRSRIGRGAANAIAVAVQLQVYGRTYGVTGSVPLKAQVSVGNTSSYSSSEAYDCTGSYGSWSTAKTLYYTGTAASGTKVYARCTWSSNPTAATTHTAPAYATTYAVTYSANGGTGTTAAQSKTYGTALTLRSCGFAREGYAFKNWNTKADGSGTSYAAGASYTANAAVTLYAIWTHAAAAVTYHPNGGQGVTEPQSKRYGETLSLRACGFTREGHCFLQWNTAPDGSGEGYDAGAAYTREGETTLYAIWTPDTYAVTYAPNGGEGAVAGQTKIWGRALVLREGGFTRRGWAFLGWNTAPDGSGESHAAGGSYTQNAAAVLYAQWQRRNVPVYVNDGGAVRQAEKAYMNLGGVIRAATVYINAGGVIYEIA